MTNQPVAVPVPLRHEMFAAELGTPFTIRFTDAQFDLVLREATALAHHMPHIHSRAPFSLLFVCTDNRILEQGNYAIAHERLGMFEIFIVPVAADADGVHYEAVFN